MKVSEMLAHAGDALEDAAGANAERDKAKHPVDVQHLIRAADDQIDRPRPMKHRREYAADLLEEAISKTTVESVRTHLQAAQRWIRESL